MAKFCVKCGAPLSGAFCGKCGTDMRSVTSPNQPQQVTQMQSQSVAPPTAAVQIQSRAQHPTGMTPVWGNRSLSAQRIAAPWGMCAAC